MFIFKETKVRHQWVDHCENRRKLALNAYKLLAHPEATAEQIAEVRRVAQDTEKRHREMLELLYAKYPQTDWRTYETV